ncbi:hypothetical protein BC828DRAFT_257893 [Blastocladiella britannica]|nr:hypothetical protein BC828DRAFT_257893 [Blastocladiella britannica]
MTEAEQNWTPRQKAAFYQQYKVRSVFRRRQIVLNSMGFPFSSLGPLANLAGRPTLNERADSNPRSRRPEVRDRPPSTAQAPTPGTFTDAFAGTGHVHPDVHTSSTSTPHVYASAATAQVHVHFCYHHPYPSHQGVVPATTTTSDTARSAAPTTMDRCALNGTSLLHAAGRCRAAPWTHSTLSLARGSSWAIARRTAFLAPLRCRSRRRSSIDWTMGKLGTCTSGGSAKRGTHRVHIPYNKTRLLPGPYMRIWVLRGDVDDSDRHRRTQCPSPAQT